jgi:lysophospholipase L1-like esterase
MHKRMIWTLAITCVVVVSNLANAIETQDPDRWQEVVRKFEAADSVSAPPENAIVFTGSSSIVFWSTLQRDMTPLTVINRGFGGSTLRDLNFWLDPLVLKYKPRAVVVYEGDNDIGEAGLSAEGVLEGFKVLISRIQQRLPESRIYVLSIKPSIRRWSMWPEMQTANSLVKSFCESREKVTYIDVATSMLDSRGQPRAGLFGPDGLHMNPHGYDIWISALKPTLLANENPSRHTR